MSEEIDHQDPPWVHRTVLHAVASWILIVGVAFSFNTVWTFSKERQRAERDVRIVRDSGVQRIYHDGRVRSQDEIVRMLHRRPYWAALPFFALALAMGTCAWFSFRRPIAASALALGIAVLGGVAYLTRDGVWDALYGGFFVVLWVILAVGIRSAVGYERVHRARQTQDAI